MHLGIRILHFLEKDYYTFLTIKLEEVKRMEEKIINKLRKSKRNLQKLYNSVKKYIDVDSEMINSDDLLMLQLISKTSEELTDIIYMILDNKNS